MESARIAGSSTTIGEVRAAMRAAAGSLPAGGEHLRYFLDTYERTTAAVESALEAAAFEDPAWVQDWDVAFAGFYLDALRAHMSGEAGAAVTRPWRLALGAPADLTPLQHVLAGMNAHINFDLPQALLAVIPDEDFTDPVLLARRHRDHERVDAVLAGRVSAENAELARHSVLSLLDRALRPLNQRAAIRFLREGRAKVWHNTMELHRARLRGPQDLAARVAELEVLSAARVDDLLAPGQVLLRLAAGGFGVRLPPPDHAPES